MVTLLITAFAILALIGIGIYFWQKPSSDYFENVLPLRPDARGLFAQDTSTGEEETEPSATVANQLAEELLGCARRGERSALNRAHATGDRALYDQVLTELVKWSDTDAKLLALISHVGKNELPVNADLAKAVIASLKRTPGRSLTSMALHFAALSDEAGLYHEALESALELWREEKLIDVKPDELKALFDGEFWILSSRTRSSGAGFVLKRTLDSARRELEAASARQ
jgi:hypothetical protein